MIEVKLLDIVNAAEAVGRIGQAKLPAKAAWRISRLISKMLAEHRDYMKVRTEHFKRHGTTTDNGNTYSVAPEKMVELDAELDAVLSETVKLDYDPIPLSLFGNVELAPADMAAAEKFLVDDTPEQPKE